MESLPSSNLLTSSSTLSFWNYLCLFLLRPLSAILLILITLALGWWLAWKSVLVHVPLVQEIFGLRKKPPKAQPPKRIYTQYYNARDAARNRVLNQSS